MENFKPADSSIQKIINKEGGLPSFSAYKHFADLFRTQEFTDASFREILSRELPKNEKENGFISFFSRYTDELRTKHQIPPLVVEPKHVHVLPAKDLESASEALTQAFYVYNRQAIFIREGFNIIEFSHKVNHEMLHFKGFNSVEVLPNGMLSPKQIGVSVYDHNEKTLLHENLNEAMTEILNMRMIKRLFQEKNLAENIKKSYKDLEQIKENLGLSENKKGETFKILEPSEEDVYFFNKDTYEPLTYAYPDQRKAVLSLIETIAKKQPPDSEISDKEKVWEIFEKAYMTGDLLPLEKILDESFGVGTFRKLGMVDRLSTGEKSDKNKADKNLGAFTSFIYSLT